MSRAAVQRYMPAPPQTHHTQDAFFSRLSLPFENSSFGSPFFPSICRACVCCCVCFCAGASAFFDPANTRRVAQHSSSSRMPKPSCELGGCCLQHRVSPSRFLPPLLCENMKCCGPRIFAFILHHGSVLRPLCCVLFPLGARQRPAKVEPRAPPSLARALRKALQLPHTQQHTHTHAGSYCRTVSNIF